MSSFNSSSQEIRVTVVQFGVKADTKKSSQRSNYQMQYRCPETGLKVTKSSGVKHDGTKRARVEAERVAAKWEQELREGKYHAPGKISWDEFRDAYSNEKLPSLAKTSREKSETVLDSIERIVKPRLLSDLTAARLSKWQAELRSNGLAETTIAGNGAHLRAALNWAKQMGHLVAVPHIVKPQRAKGGKMMKGRPITGEEFERMLASVVAVVGAAAAPSWRFYLQGLWASGLRLSESLELFWDNEAKLCVDLSGRRPMLRIPAGLEKGNQNRLLPMAPEFAELLMQVPEAERTGAVFNPQSKQDQRKLTMLHISKTIAAIGKRAGVVVNRATKLGEPVIKYASAHDCRRSFGERWAARLMPTQLMELMRHENINTTMRYYVGRNAQATADVLWAAHEQHASQPIKRLPTMAPENAGRDRQ